MAGITENLELVLQGKDLSFDQSRSVLDEIFTGTVPRSQVAAFLTGLKIKGEKSQEIAGLARSLRDHAIKVKPKVDHLVDTCGTGGAKIKTFNISTAAGLVAASAGVRVAKHGNRGITSKCGSADVLKGLGINIEAPVEKIEQCIEEANFGFMFAPMFHPAMKFVQPIRKELPFRTVFNILGPLANPANAAGQVMGVAEESLMKDIIQTLKLLGVKRAVVVHSNGLDEISTLSITKIMELKDGDITSYDLDPQKYDIPLTDINTLKGDTPEINSRIVKEILYGKEKGNKKDIVVINAAAAIMVSGLTDDYISAIKIADQSIKDGKAADTLEKVIKITNS